MPFRPLAYLLVASCLAIRLQATPTLVPGTLPGDVSVDSTGGVSYSIPIEIPAGTGGMQPDLALTYSNQAGNGPLGVGWSVGGLSAITRGPTIYARDGYADGMDFDDSDKFYLDGQRLLKVAESAGSPYFIEYRTELESFSRIRAYGASLSEAATAPTHWTVETKAGLTMSFGHDFQSNQSKVVFTRIEDGNDFGGTVGWQLSRVQDSVGNHFDLFYKLDSTYGSTLLIDEIRYTANGSSLDHYAKVKFNYELRTDDVRGGFYGFKTRLLGRTKDIQVLFKKEGTFSEIARYDLSYVYSSLGYSRIQSIALTRTQAGSQTFQMQPTTFLYSEGVLPFKKSTDTGIGISVTPGITNGALGSWDLDNPPQFYTTDLNGDTKPELVKQWREASSNFKPFRYQVYVPSGSSFQASGGVQTFVNIDVTTLRQKFSDYNISGCFSDTRAYETAIFADFNFDGLTDVFLNNVLEAHVNSSGNYWKTLCTRRLMLRTAAGGWTMAYNEQHAVTNLEARDSARATWEFVPADIDGDGTIELIHFDPEAVTPPPSSGIVRVKILKTSDPASGTYFNNTIFVKNVAGTFLDVTVNSLWNLRTFVMDHDGDGTPDIACSLPNALKIHMMSSGAPGPGAQPWPLGTIRNWPPGLKGSTSTPFVLSFAIGRGNADAISAADFDGDGRDDILTTTRQTGKVSVARLPLSGEDYFEDTPPWLRDPVRNPDVGEEEWWYQTVATEEAQGRRDKIWSYWFQVMGGGVPKEVFALNAVPFDAEADGKADLIIAYSLKNYDDSYQSGIALYRSNSLNGQRGAVAFTKDTTQTGTGYGKPTTMDDPREFVDSLTVFDTDLDGMPELVQFRKQNSVNSAEVRRWELFSNTVPVVNDEPCPWANLLYYVENGNGTGTSVKYKPMTDSAVYTRLPDRPTFPIIDVFGPSPLACAVGRESADGVAYWSTYGYTGARAHAQGRGSLGFASFTSFNSDTGIGEEQILEQAFPFTGMVRETRRYLLESSSYSVLSRDINTNSYDLVRLPDGTPGTAIFPMVVQAVGYKWEDVTISSLIALDSITGSAYSAVTSKTWFDGQPLGVDPPVRTNFTDPNPLGDGYLTYGNITKVVIDSGDGYKSTTENTYEPVVATGGWILGRLKTAEATSTAPGQSSITKKSAFKYDEHGLLRQEFVQPTSSTGDTLGALTVKTYERDDYGNIWQESVAGSYGDRSGPNSFSWTSTIIATRSGIDATKRFFGTTTNALTHEETKTFDDWGRVLTHTGPNRLQTSWTYHDPFGIHVTETRPDTTTAETNVEILATGSRFTVAPPSGVTVTYAPSAAYTVKTIRASGAPEAKAYYDRFGREVRTEVQGFNGALIRRDTLYDRYSRAVAASENYYASGRPAAFSDLPDFNGSQWSRSEYDALGRVKKVIAPNLSETLYTYLGRVSKVTRDAQAGGRQQTQTTLVNAIGKTMKVWNADRDTSGIDQMGNGASGSASVVFTYDAVGNLKTTAAAGAVTTMGYDISGNKTSMTDPDMGSWSYEYDALGRLRYQTDAKSQTTRLSYDALGRLQKRATIDNSDRLEVTRWEYDGTGQFDWIGAIRREFVLKENQGNGNADILETVTASQIRTQHGYQYDEKGRQIVDLRQIDGKWYYTYTRYDRFGRPKSINYFWRPTGLEDTPSVDAYNWQSFGLKYRYDYLPDELAGDPGSSTYMQTTGVGFMTEVRDHQERSWWNSPTYDQEGRVIQSRKGTVWTLRDYRETDHTLASITSGFSAGGTDLQDLSYAFDNVGNLTSRTDRYWTHQEQIPTPPALSETFGYDTLNRLTTQNGATVANYFDNGNILWKKDVNGSQSANYTYGTSASQPHAVKSAFGYSMTYDQNGLMATRSKSGQPNWNFTWSVSNMIKWIFDGLDGSEYEYDGAQSRIREIRKVNGVEVEKKIFAPGFEQFFEKTGGTWTAKRIRVYIGAPDGVAGVFEYRADQPTLEAAQSLTLLFTDHLGSVDLSVTIPGSSFLGFALESSRQKFSYDPWGQRRNETDWIGERALSTSQLAGLATDRGFTGHEMLDELGLVNMNARIYDPLLGRFLSADTFVQSPGDLQSYNRYSYVHNNPLSYTDPSGHFLSGLFKSIGNFFKKYWKTIIVIVVAVVVSYFTFGAASGWAAGWVASAGLTGTTAAVASGAIAGAIAGAAAGFASGFLGAALAGGGFGSALSAGLTSAAWGALSGAAAGAIGGYLGSKTGKFWTEVKRAAAHGVSSGVVDDLRGGSFVAGFASGAFSTAATHGLGIAEWDIYPGAAAAAVIGGTASVIGGGKFENGAMYGAFQFMFNAKQERLRHPEPKLGGLIQGPDEGAGPAVILEFDGCELTARDAEGRIVGVWEAASGREGYQDPDFQNEKGKGPLPEGIYLVNQAAYQERPISTGHFE